MVQEAVKVTPLIFSASMVRALLDNRKTQTRRIVKDPPIERDGYLCTKRLTFRDAEQYARIAATELCPYGRPGDLIWVREKCRAEELDDDAKTPGLDGIRYAADDRFKSIENSPEAAGAWGKLRGPGGHETAWRWRPSIHMPRWASRLTLRLTDVRVERVQEISEDDARAEGITDADILTAKAILSTLGLDEGTAVDAFRLLWNDIHGFDAWARNDWVRRLSFEVIKANVDTVLKEAA